MSLIQESRNERQSRGRWGLGWFAVFAAAAAVVSSTAMVVDGWKAAQHWTPPPEARAINAVGTARRHVQPDRLLWTATITTHAADRATTLRRLSADVQTLRDFLGGHEIQESEISIFLATSQEETETVTHRSADGTEEEHERTTGFSATQKVELHSRDVARAVRALQALALAPGLVAELEADEPACSYSALDALQEEVLGAARADLRTSTERAVSQIARAQRAKLVTTDLGMFSAPVLGSSSLDACERGTDATATVTAEYALE